MSLVDHTTDKPTLNVVVIVKHINPREQGTILMAGRPPMNKGERASALSGENRLIIVGI